jgi:hypothetical protein
MSSIATPQTGAAPADGPAGAFTAVLNAAVSSAAASLEHTVESWTEKLNGVVGGSESGDGLVSLADEGIDELAKDGGAKEKAGAEGLKAKLEGKNPLRAAIAGAWSAGTPVVRAAIVAGVVAVILLLLLSPVLLTVFLLSLLVIAAVQRVRAAKR